MKYTLATLTGWIVFILPSTGLASVENLVSLQRDAQGRFTVLCDNDGSIKQTESVTADMIRADGVCMKQVVNGDLEEGLYTTSTEFCGQTLKWSGDRIIVILSAPCNGQLQMEKTANGWYRGGMPGYSYVYEIEVKSTTSYLFHSRSFGTSGDFVKSSAATNPPPGPSLKRSLDPVSR